MLIKGLSDVASKNMQHGREVAPAVTKKLKPRSVALSEVGAAPWITLFVPDTETSTQTDPEALFQTIRGIKVIFSEDFPLGNDSLIKRDLLPWNHLLPNQELCMFLL